VNEKRILRGGEGKPDDLSKPEVTNLPSAHDAKGDAALEKEIATDASSGAFRTAISQCRATHADHLTQPYTSLNFAPA